MRFKMVHSHTNNAKSRVPQSQVCYLRTTHFFALKVRGMGCSTLGINQHWILGYVRMKNCEAHLMVTSRVIDPKGLRRQFN